MKKLQQMMVILLGVCLILTGCNAATGDEASEAASSAASQITVEQQGSVPQDKTYDWKPKIDQDKTYHFGILDTAYTAKLLTDFSVGTVVLEAQYGKYEFSNGALRVRTGGQFADSYHNYSGSDLSGGDYQNADYVGIRLKNNQDNEVFFGLQGNTANGRNIFFSEKGADIVLAYDDGRAYKSAITNTTYRYTATIPAGFEGYLLVPLSRLCDTADTATAKAWIDTGRSPFQKIGFHVTGGGTASVEIMHLFLGEGELPAVTAAPGSISNPEYSYTDEQRVLPFWESDIMYNECLTFEQKGDDISGTLLFVPTRIISVVDVTQKIEYQEGKDFEWVKGTNKIKWLKGSSIPYFYEGALAGLKEAGSKDYVPQGSWDDQGRQRLGNVLYCVGAFLYEKQVSVTYEYDLAQVKSQGVLHTAYQGDRLPKTMSKLKNNEDLKILFYGDSVLAGCDASSMYGRAPSLPTMDKLLMSGLQEKTTGKVIGKNISVGGWGYQDGLAALTGTVTKNGTSHNYSDQYEGYDLLVLSFGGNNGNVPADQVTAGLQKIIDQIRTKSPDIEVLLFSPLRANPDAAGFTGTKETFGTAYQKFADEKGYAYTNIYAIHESILKYKNYSSTSGNNINHPNDWLIRIHVMNMLAAMFNFSG